MRIALIFLLISCVIAPAASKYADRMFRRAVVEDTTSPFYLLFVLHDPKTGADRVVCTVGSSLVGAIYLEHHLAYKDATAHAMLERGILVSMDDRAGGVYIAQ